MRDTHHTQPINQVRVVGTLDTQAVSRRDAAQLPGVVLDTKSGERPRATLVRRINQVQGTERRAVLQVRSPFGTPFQIALHVADGIEGCELLETSAPGTLLAAVGELEWVQTTDPRYAVDPGERGRRASELLFRAQAIRLASPEDEPGCDVWLEGVVLTTSRVLRHPERPVLIAVTTVRVNVERTRKGSRARITEPANVAVAIPVDHPDAPNLLRQGNQVVIEGMLERYVVPLKGVEVDRAVAALDEAWAEEESGLNTPQARRDAERRYSRQRRRLQETTRTRVVAGYVELIAGAPASLDEAQELRAESQRRRREDRRRRRDAEPGPGLSTEETADTADGEPPESAK